MSTVETVGMDRSRPFPPLPVALVVLVALAAYATSLGNGYAYDDVWIIQNNARVHELSNLREIWLTSYWPEFGDELGAYRPLTIFLFAVQWALAGGKPWIFHAINVALHAVVCVFVLFLLRRSWGWPPPSGPWCSRSIPCTWKPWRTAWVRRSSPPPRSCSEHASSTWRDPAPLPPRIGRSWAGS